MNTNKDLNYRLYIQKNDGLIRTPIHREFSRYSDIKEGRVEQVKKNFLEIQKDYLSGKGILSDNMTRNVRYHVIISTAMVARACVEGGMPHDIAYTLSDIFIRRADVCDDVQQLVELLGEMQIEFATRMHENKKNPVVSLHIRKCIDYIYENLDQKLTIQELADYTKLNPSYLSKLFSSETGCTTREFVHEAKIGTAKNMLLYSDFSSVEISLALGFSSQSAFVALFHKLTGQTSKQFKNAVASSVLLERKEKI